MPAGFEKISHSNDSLFGPRKLLLCGFPRQAQSKFAALLSMIGLREIELIWATAEHAHRTLAELMEEPHGFGQERSSDLPRAVIVAGISEKELHSLMTGCRNARMHRALWATLTPTSQGWTLHDLLTELKAERDAFARKRQPRHEA